MNARFLFAVLALALSAFHLSPDGYSEERGEGIDFYPMWVLNILQGSPLVVEAKFINRENSLETTMDLFDPSEAVEITVSEIIIDRVLYAEPTVLFDSRFNDFVVGGKFTPFTMKVLFNGSKKELLQARDGIVILHPDILFGRYFYDPIVQIQDYDKLNKVLQTRKKIFNVWMKRSDIMPNLKGGAQCGDD